MRIRAVVLAQYESMKNRLRAIGANLHLRHVTVLATGTAVSQAVSLAIAPLLTRLYAPSAFALLALFVAIVSAIAPGIGGRYDMAAIVAKEEEERTALVKLSVAVAAVVTVLYCIALLVARDVMSRRFGVDALGYWLWVTPAALYATGLITSLRASANGSGRFRILGSSSIIQSASASILSLIIGVIVPTDAGLLVAYLIATVLTVAHLVKSQGTLRALISAPWTKAQLTLALRYKDYPVFNGLMSTLGGFSAAMPVLFISATSSATVVGHYALLTRVGTAPFSLFSDAISRVQVRQLSKRMQDGNDLIPSFLRWTALLSAIALPPTTIVMAAGPQLFAWVFGEPWREAGRMLSTIMPGLAVQFIVSSLSLSWLAFDNLRLPAIWQGTSFLATLGILTWASKQNDIDLFLRAIVLKDVSIYFIKYLLMFYACKQVSSPKLPGKVQSNRGQDE